jgi:TetR/AcrR family transcriptional regulator, mexJK operon transcriptional repressor
MVASTGRFSACRVEQPVPRGERRRREIAAVAEQVFFENGFTDATMQSIAVRAGASKETLYRHFGSKEELFAELVEARARDFIQDLDEHFSRTGTVEQILTGVGLRGIEMLFDPIAIKLCRTVIAESPRNPALGCIFLDEGPHRVRLGLSKFLTGATARGELACPDPDQAATFFFGLVMASLHLERLVLIPPPRMSEDEVRHHVDEAVAIFLARYAPRRSASTAS